MSHGFSVLSDQKKSNEKGMSNREYRSAMKGESIKFRLINTIDACMKEAKTKSEFIKKMKEKGWEVKWEEDRKYITYTSNQGFKCRDNKLHSQRYLKERMEKEFERRYEILNGRIKEDEYAEGCERASQTYGEYNSGAYKSGEAGEKTDRCDGAVFQYDVGSSEGYRGEAFGLDLGREGSEGEQFQSDFEGNYKADSSFGGAPWEDGGDSETGWEQEREILFSEYTSAGIPSVNSYSVDFSDVWDSTVGIVSSLEKLGDTTPVKDSTSMPQVKRHKSRSVFSKHKESDEPEFGQHM